MLFAVVWRELFALHCTLLWCILMGFLSGEYTCKLAICITLVQLPNWSRSLLNKPMNKNKTTMQPGFLTQFMCVCAGVCRALSSHFWKYSDCLKPYYRCIVSLYVGHSKETVPFVLEKFRVFPLNHFIWMGYCWTLKKSYFSTSGSKHHDHSHYRH